MNIRQSLEKFKKLPLEYSLTVDSDFVAKEMQRINNKYEIDIGPLIIMVSVGDLSVDNVVSFLMSEFKLNVNQSRIIFDEINKNIFKPLRQRIDFINSNPQKNFSVTKERQIILDIFRKNLVQEIKNNVIIINAVNQRIFYHLAINLDFKKEIEKALYNNEEQITSKKIVINEKEVQPTVGNWIKYFIKDSGSDMFDNLVLSKFISNSRYAVVLPDDEKELLINVLKTYRNIKFFPDSMPNDDVDNMLGWEIIPISNQDVKHQKDDDSKNISNKHDNKNNNKIKKESSLSQKEKIIKAYMKEMEKYKIGSIERKVIEQEIKNIKIK